MYKKKKKNKPIFILLNNFSVAYITIYLCVRYYFWYVLYNTVEYNIIPNLLNSS